MSPCGRMTASASPPCRKNVQCDSKYFGLSESQQQQQQQQQQATAAAAAAGVDWMKLLLHGSVSWPHTILFCSLETRVVSSILHICISLWKVLFSSGSSSSSTNICSSSTGSSSSTSTGATTNAFKVSDIQKVGATNVQQVQNTGHWF